ncbi:P-loop containing nucleoside triphosphate hydrolase protein [Panus rudis PR-1116 ss-1]|nr:P-loop containing nucleoside triphosphate hydrolase protein [Panus rudis PR-1116 ss-1]
MPRRVPFSHKQKKAQLQLKRAVHRGDVSPPPPMRQDRRRKKGRGVTDALAARAHGHTVSSAPTLQSTFVQLPLPFLEKTRDLASQLPLNRPIQLDAALLRDPSITIAHTDSDDISSAKPVLLTCPRRPKWRYDATKEMVEKNEQALFAKWLEQTDQVINDRYAMDPHETPDEPPAMPHAPTTFERNIEVWRQLWRVTEIADILLILVDSRCPILHYPPSLSDYLSNPYLTRRTRVILVLTKVDIVGPVRAEAWTRYLKQRYPDLRIVPVESYQEKSAGEGSGKRKVYEPHLPSVFRQTLVKALKETHAEFLQPPERLRDHPERLAKWKPRVKRDIDWDAVLHAKGGQVGHAVGGATAPRFKDQDETHRENSDEEEIDIEPEFLTVGLIGQPNVGKSSLLNALFGTTKVRASRTPGKTKHFQTLFWTSDVRLVDCPGLVMPNLIPMETQVLSGILPISRVSAVPLCVYHAANLLPLERIYALEHPSPPAPPVEDKRTWREPRITAQNAQVDQKEVRWTAMDVLTAFALKKGWVTAKTGRPDVYRAGNAILRTLAQGEVKWGFWPPDTDLEIVGEHSEAGNGIWIPHAEQAEWDIMSELDDDYGGERERELEDEDGNTASSEGEEADEQGDQGEFGDEYEDERIASTGSRFGALLLAGEDVFEEDEEEKNDQ